jgi:HD superfamily phosphohydrolase
MIIYDNIHGYITIDSIASSIIDTTIFQRLRFIHQTGIMYLVYPTANHSRFEHSIGTYHLAKTMIESIMKKQPELNITEEIVLLVSIAGLCHDLGHMMFSHLFDDCFLPKLPHYKDLCDNTTNIHHENRSIVLLYHMVEKYKIKLSKQQLKVIGDLINPKQSEYSKWKPQYQIGKWIFQIISNPINSIDVDKFDYLTRDTNAVGLKMGFDYSRIINEARVYKQTICYSQECNEDIYQMFFLRYRLHRQIYNNKTVKSIEIMILKLLFEIEKTHSISNYIMDPEKMIQLVDHMIWHIDKSVKCSDIIEQINMRQLPKLVYQDISINPIEFDMSLLSNIDKEDYNIIKFKVGYVGGKTNPLNNITFYDLDTKEIISEQLSRNKVKDFSLLINQKHQEHIIRIYCCNNDKLLLFTNIFNMK